MLTFILQLGDIAAALPQDPITKGRSSLFFARVEVVSSQIILVGWKEFDSALLKVLQEHLVELIIRTGLFGSPILVEFNH